MEFADEGDLRGYLIKNKSNIQWEEKLNLAIQIAEGIAYIHNELNIAHRDLHTKNILVHRGNAKISDFGLFKCLNSATTTRSSQIFGIIPFVEPQVFNDTRYKPDKMSDIYSLGVLFWEISSCYAPFRDVINQTTLGTEIFMGLREKPIPGTPLEYVDIYSRCWKAEPTQRLKLNDILYRLKATSLTPVFEDSIIPEAEAPSVQYLSNIIKVEHPLGIYELGHCYQNGIGAKRDAYKAFMFYQKSAELGNSNGELQIGFCYQNGSGVKIDECEAFIHYKKSAAMKNSEGMVQCSTIDFV
ncbi:kinase-like domain-containing protein [Gigaspora rosea]|uniref:Kinase-like domain-containing protein n=1 Tax=Gigaspora rosea TaxID=44941 RepID=A0A397VXJ9_9GLOM|nr:kinase-like domain-containing protein [Gigaspora rosea]